MKKQNQHLTRVKDLREQELFGRSSEKTEDILEQALTGEDNPKDPLDEQAPVDDGTDVEGTPPPKAPKAPETEGNSGDGEKKPRKPKEKGKRDRDLAGLPVCTEFITCNSVPNLSAICAILTENPESQAAG